MNQLKKEDAARFKIQFSQWEKCLTSAKAKTCEDLYKKVHSSIIANPDRVKRAAKKPVRKVGSDKYQRVFTNSKGNKWLREFRITNAMRKQNVAQKFTDAQEAYKQ